MCRFPNGFGLQVPKPYAPMAGRKLGDEPDLKLQRDLFPRKYPLIIFVKEFSRRNQSSILGIM